MQKYLEKFYDLVVCLVAIHIMIKYSSVWWSVLFLAFAAFFAVCITEGRDD